MSAQCSPVHWESDDEPVVVTKADEALLRAKLQSLLDDEEQPAPQRGRKKMYASKDEKIKAAAKLEAMRQERLRREVPVAPRTQYHGRRAVDLPRPRRRSADAPLAARR